MPHTRRVVMRRRRLKEAALGHTRGAQGPALTDAAPLSSYVGKIADASPHLLVLITNEGDEVRLTMSEATLVWYGTVSGPSTLNPGREVVVRPMPNGTAAERIWVDITRVTGTIVGRTGETLEVDGGPHRGAVKVVIPRNAFGRIQVRHPQLEPGYLLDVIGLRSADGVVGLIPGTSQPGYPADRVPEARPTKPVPQTLRGTATWYADPARPGARGIAYPALDSTGDAGGCVGAPHPCVQLPLLSKGSELYIRNECSGRATTFPIIECGCTAARYCDRCVECGTSPRGRVVELTRACFADLGGDLVAGCFNVTITTG